MANSKPNPKVIERLAEFFRRNGYIRRASPVRRKKEKARYKKGDEVRLVADSRKELAEIRRLLRAAGFRRRSPFAKGRQWRQPVYGVAEVARFLAMIGEADAGRTPSSARSAR